jgi:hypothetical protein
MSSRHLLWCLATILAFRIAWEVEDARIVVFGVLAVGGAFFAAHAPSGERGAALGVSLILLAVWAVYVMPWVWEPASIAGVLYRLGVTSITHMHVAIAVDALASMAVLTIGAMHKWAWGIWGCFIFMLCDHATADIFGVPYYPYSRALDAAFLAQLAILYMLGGRGVFDNLSRGFDRVRRLRRVRALGASSAGGVSDGR